MCHFIIPRAHNSENVCVKHEQSGKFLIVFKLIHRIRVDGRKQCENATGGHDFFENGEKSCVFSVDRASVSGFVYSNS